MSSFTEKLNNAFRFLRGQANQAVATGKKQLEIKQLENKVAGVHKKIGKLMYERHRQKYPDISLNEPSLKQLLEEIDVYQKKIRDLQLED